jgi:hypothetical protein
LRKIARYRISVADAVVQILGFFVNPVLYESAAREGDVLQV